MADQGAIGENGLLTLGTVAGNFTPFFLGIDLGGATDPLLAFAGRNDTEGTPTPPSQQHPRPGTLKDIFWRVVDGINTLTIDCKYTGQAPRVIVKQAPALGLQTDYSLGAPAGTDWVTITIVVTIVGTGVLQVWRERLESDLSKSLYWDRLIT